MAIVNLLIKPFTSFVLYRLYQDRGGSYADFGIPGMPDFGAGGKCLEQLFITHEHNNAQKWIPSPSLLGFGQIPPSGPDQNLSNA